MVAEAHGVSVAHESLVSRTRFKHLLEDHHVELGDLPKQQHHAQIFVVAGLEPLAAVDAFRATENLNQMYQYTTLDHFHSLQTALETRTFKLSTARRSCTFAMAL